MSDPHFELPAHPNLEYYRKQAKHLQHAYETGDAAAQARVAEVLGDRAAGRFLLSDAQFILAQEHGFRTWAEFRAHIESRRTTGDRPVSRLSGIGPGTSLRSSRKVRSRIHSNVLRPGSPGSDAVTSHSPMNGSSRSRAGLRSAASTRPE